MTKRELTKKCDTKLYAMRLSVEKDFLERFGKRARWSEDVEKQYERAQHEVEVLIDEDWDRKVAACRG